MCHQLQLLVYYRVQWLVYVSLLNVFILENSSVMSYTELQKWRFSKSTISMRLRYIQQQQIPLKLRENYGYTFRFKEGMPMDVVLSEGSTISLTHVDQRAVDRRVRVTLGPFVPHCLRIMYRVESMPSLCHINGKRIIF